MLRALHRNSSNDGAPYRQVTPYRSFKRSNAMLLQPGEIATLTFDLLPTPYQFKKEHSIRIAIACADKDIVGDDCAGHRQATRYVEIACKGGRSAGKESSGEKGEVRAGDRTDLQCAGSIDIAPSIRRGTEIVCVGIQRQNILLVCRRRSAENSILLSILASCARQKKERGEKEE